MPAILLAALMSMTVAPSNAQQAIATAPPGVLIKLSPGEYGRIEITGKTWTNPITIDATEASLTLAIRRSSGVNVTGGKYSNAIGPAMNGYAIWVQQSERINLKQLSISNSTRAIVLDRSRDIEVSGADMVGMKVDGIDISSSQRVKITKSRCTDFDTGKAHPDCIQMWSRPKDGITQDVEIIGNRSEGKMQGITGFNHIRNGVDDGGFDRITISDNVVIGTFPNGIAINACRDCTITNNVTRTAPGSKYKVSINIVRCERCTVKKNVSGGRP